MMRSSPPTSSVAMASPPPSSSPPQPGIPTAAAPPIAASLSRSRRESSCLTQFMSCLLSGASSEGAPRKTLDEPVEEDVVEKGDRGARDERERIDELVEREREREDDDGEDSRDRDGEDDPPEGPQPGGAVHLGGVLELPRDRLEEPHQEPGGERDREGGVDEHERDEVVLEAHLGDHPRERQEEEGGGDQGGGGDADPEALSPAPGEARERVAGGNRECERDRHDDDAHEGRVHEPADVLRLREEEVDVRERGSVVEDERVVVLVVEVTVRLEGRDEHQVKGVGEHDRERPDDEVGGERPPGTVPQH